MSELLVVCAGCHRHIRAAERACPFCQVASDAPPPASRPGAMHTAVLVAAFALAASQRAEAQLVPPESPRLGMEHGGAQGYGAPPLGMPMVGLVTSAPPVDSASVPAVFELAQQPMRPPGRRSRVAAPWSITLRIAENGAWTAPGRSGHLSPEQLDELRGAAARASVGVRPLSPRGRVTPTRVERLTLRSGSVSWPSPSATAPSEDLTRLIALARRLTRR